MTTDSSQDRSVTRQAMEVLALLGSLLDQYLSTAISALCRVLHRDDLNPLPVREAAVRSLTNISEHGLLGNTAADAIRALCGAAATHPPLQATCMEAVVLLVRELGAAFVLLGMDRIVAASFRDVDTGPVRRLAHVAACWPPRHVARVSPAVRHAHGCVGRGAGAQESRIARNATGDGVGRGGWNNGRAIGGLERLGVAVYADGV